ncbi:hypothetical protein VTO73DRAFT_13324 [Trametes versicolor]
MSPIGERLPSATLAACADLVLRCSVCACYIGSATPYAFRATPILPTATMRFLKLYEHPEFKAEPEDVTLLSTICFVLALALAGALFILAGSCLLFWDDCSTTFQVYSSRPHVLTLNQLLHG